MKKFINSKIYKLIVPILMFFSSLITVLVDTESNIKVLIILTFFIFSFILLVVQINLVFTEEDEKLSNETLNRYRHNELIEENTRLLKSIIKGYKLIDKIYFSYVLGIKSDNSKLVDFNQKIQTSIDQIINSGKIYEKYGIDNNDQFHFSLNSDKESKNEIGIVKLKNEHSDNKTFINNFFPHGVMVYITSKEELSKRDIPEYFYSLIDNKIEYRFEDGLYFGVEGTKSKELEVNLYTDQNLFVYHEKAIECKYHTVENYISIDDLNGKFIHIYYHYSDLEHDLLAAQIEFITRGSNLKKNFKMGNQKFIKRRVGDHIVFTYQIQ